MCGFSAVALQALISAKPNSPYADPRPTRALSQDAYRASQLLSLIFLRHSADTPRPEIPATSLRAFALLRSHRPQTSVPLAREPLCLGHYCTATVLLSRTLAAAPGVTLPLSCPSLIPFPTRLVRISSILPLPPPLLPLFVPAGKCTVESV